MKQILETPKRPRPFTPRASLALSLASLLLALTCAGCKPDAKAAAETKAMAEPAADINPVGVYALVTVDGKQVPCTVQHEGHTMTVNSGSFSINVDGTCSSKISLAGMANPIEVKATYTREGPKLKMQWQGAGTTLGTVEANTFTMNNEGMVFAYRK